MRPCATHTLLLVTPAGACLGKGGVPGHPKCEAAAESKAGRAEEIFCVAHKVFTEEMCLVVFKRGYYRLHHALMTSCVAAADVMGGNDSGVRWLGGRRCEGSFHVQAGVA